MCEECGCGIPEDSKKQISEHKEEINLYKNLLEENEKEADENRKHFFEHEVFAVNLMGSPGAGKTSLLEAVAKRTKGKLNMAVIEGDLATERDAQRMKNIGVEAVQVMTGSTCHLDAKSVHKAIHHLNLDIVDILFVENVGNLVCPALYDIGCHINGVVLSVAEGSDKVAKYPVIFRKSQFMVVSKTDLLPYLDFNIDQPKQEAKLLKGDIKFFKLSSKTEEGIEEFVNYLLEKRREVFE
ncbi:MAG: hydrogenase nickel incorporation protein HypB [Acidobacteria bacterium]|nr:hydrogenase nickel incorporation protein HypB [Acidobacteriota bacterium]